MIALPKTFIVGAATAAYQVEGASKEDGKGRVLWDAFLEKEGRFSPDPASDFYHRYEEDIRLAHEHGITALRISIAWSRIFPHGSGEANAKGVEYYRKVFETCLRYNIEPYVTLHHFDTPETLFLQGDWLNKNQISAFEDYAAFVFEAYHDIVKHWITINEPIAYAQGQYLSGAFPPGEKYERLKCVQSQHNQLVAHSRVVNLFKEKGYQGEIGLVHALTQFYSIDQQPQNIEATRKHDIFMNGFMLDATFLGNYTDEKLTTIKTILADEFEQLDIRKEELDTLKIAAPQLDFIGINYYQSNWIQYHQDESYIFHNGTGDKGTSVYRIAGIGEVVKNDKIPTTDWDWYIYPEGLYDMIQRIQNDYPNYKKMLVTENGLGYKDQWIDEETPINDQVRIDYIATHLEAISKAIKEGARVDGYFVWSLQDMFSWSNGYNKRYGLFYIDFETQKRYVKKSALWYRELAKAIAQQS